MSFPIYENDDVLFCSSSSKIPHRQRWWCGFFFSPASRKMGTCPRVVGFGSSKRGMCCLVVGAGCRGGLVGAGGRGWLYG